MIQGLESKLFRISKLEDYDDCILRIELKDTNSKIDVFKAEADELIELLQKSLELIN